MSDVSSRITSHCPSASYQCVPQADVYKRQVQLYDKVMISYQSRPGSRVKLYHKMKQGMREGLGYQSEILMPMYENLYVKQFVLYKDESLSLIHI